MFTRRNNKSMQWHDAVAGRPPVERLTDVERWFTRRSHLELDIKCRLKVRPCYKRFMLARRWYDVRAAERSQAYWWHRRRLVVVDAPEPFGSINQPEPRACIRPSAVLWAPPSTRGWRLANRWQTEHLPAAEVRLHCWVRTLPTILIQFQFWVRYIKTSQI